MSIMNAYMMYRRWQEENNFVLEYNHYDFVEASAKAWIDPINYCPAWHCLHLQHIMSNKPPAIKPNEGKLCSPITDKSLCPATDSLQRRRDTALNHSPEHAEKKNSTQCQLHMWAFKSAKTRVTNNKKPKGARACVMQCSVCNINLCMDCFQIFHQNDYLAQCIDDILSK